MSLQQNTEALIEMNGKLERMMDGIDLVKEKQMEMARLYGIFHIVKHLIQEMEITLKPMKILHQL